MLAIAYFPQLDASAARAYRFGAGFWGVADAQYQLGVMYANGQDVSQDYDTALSWFRKAADKGNADAQIALGNMYANGKGVPLDYEAAVGWWRKAADQGNASAQDALGSMYANGHGVPRDYKAALSWYQKAAEQGFADAQDALAFMYASGRGVPPDRGAAVFWYRKAADQDNANAQYALGKIYADSASPAAVFWYQKAADQGNASAQYALGNLYFGGYGVPQDYVIAHMSFSLAATEGLEEAARQRDIVTQRMTPVQIAEARKRAAEWRPKIANAGPTQAARTAVPLKMDSGILVVPVQINGSMTLDFAIDSGAADVSVPADVVSTLKRAGTIRESDFIGQQTYVLADGSQSQSATFTIRSLRVGDRVVENVRGSVASSQGSLLLGQSFLERFKSWSIDNTRHELLLEPR